MARQLRAMRDAATPDTTTTIQLLLHTSTAAFATGICELLMRRHRQDLQATPLAQYFKHSPDVKQLTIGQCPAPGEDGFPLNVSGTRILRYARPHQYLLHNVAGTYYDEYLRWDAVDSLESEVFGAYAIALPHVGYRQFIVALDPNGKESLLPQNGESCKVHFPSAVVPTSALNDRSFQRAQYDLFNILDDAETAHNPHRAVNNRTKTFLARELTPAEVDELTQTPEERESGDPDAWQTRIFQWATDNRALFVESPPVLAPVQALLATAGGAADGAADNPDTTDSTLWWSARRVDFVTSHVNSTYQTFMVNKPVESGENVTAGELRPLKNIDFPIASPHENETPTQFFNRVFNAEPQKIRVKCVSSSKTLRAETLAVNGLKHPPSANPLPPSERSINAFRYLLRFKTDHRTDLLAQNEGLRRAVEGQCPQFVREIYESMNAPMRRAFHEMRDLPAGVLMLPGVAGSGKSQALINAILMSQFGACPIDAVPENAQPQDRKELYLLNNNSGVEDFAERLPETYRALGIKNSPPVMRLYAMDGEVRDGLRSQDAQRPEVLEREAAENHLAGLGDQFLAAHALSRLCLDVHDASATLRNARRRNNDKSLHSGAVRHLDTHAEEYADLTGYMNRIKDGHELSDQDYADFKQALKALYTDYLAQFHGTIVTTPHAAAVMGFRQAFKPDLVLIDEAGTMRELTTLLGIAFFDPVAWIITGDVAQKPPYITMEHNLGSGQTSSNPYHDQLTLSLLGRAVEAGATRAGLTVNRRAWGNSASVASRLFYQRSMTVARPSGENWPPALHAMIGYVRQHINPQHPDDQCNALVEFSGAQSTKVASSQMNLTHIHWVLEHVLQIVKSAMTGLGKNQGHPIDVLITCLYKAQKNEYKRRLKQLLDDGDLSRDQYDRIKVKTLDEAQGDEADMVFADYVAVSHPGFTGTSYRGTLASTRARGFNVYLLNRGIFVGRETKENTVERAHQLWLLWNDVSSLGASLRIPCCLNCQTHEHGTATCVAEKPDMSSSVCERDNCHDKKGHTAATCAYRPCYNCIVLGHSANECPKELNCSRCGRFGHFSFDCQRDPSEFECHLCGSDRHTKWDCEMRDHPPRPEPKCRICDEPGHIGSECPKRQCRNCDELGHNAADCPNRDLSGVECRRCHEFGHYAKDCPNAHPITCNLCGADGHVARVCEQRVCRKCNGVGHSGPECTEPWCSNCHTIGHTADHCTNPKVECGNCGGEHRTEICRKRGHNLFKKGWKKGRQLGKTVNNEVQTLKILVPDRYASDDVAEWPGNDDNEEAVTWTGDADNDHAEEATDNDHVEEATETDNDYVEEATETDNDHAEEATETDNDHAEEATETDNDHVEEATEADNDHVEEATDKEASDGDKYEIGGLDFYGPSHSFGVNDDPRDAWW